MNKKLLISYAVITAATASSHAALYTWGGAGDSINPEFWNEPGTGAGQNGDSTHWGQGDTVPTTDGTDDVVINGGGIRKDGATTFATGSDLTLNSGAHFRNTVSGNLTLQSNVILNDGSSLRNATTSGGFNLNSGGSLTLNMNSTLTIDGSGVFTTGGSGVSLAVNTGSTISLNTGHFQLGSGSRVELAGGSLLFTGINANNNALRTSSIGTNGGFDFTELGSSIQIDNYAGSGTLLSYLEGKASLSGGRSFFQIDDVWANSFGAANADANGRYLEFSGTATSGTLTLMAVPEPSSTALLGLGGLALILRRRR